LYACHGAPGRLASAQKSPYIPYNENHSHMWHARLPQHQYPDAVLAHYYQELLNFCWRSLRNREAAADLVQESYLRVLGVQHNSELGEQAVREPRALLYHTWLADRMMPPLAPCLRITQLTAGVDSMPPCPSITRA